MTIKCAVKILWEKIMNFFWFESQYYLILKLLRVTQNNPSCETTECIIATPEKDVRKGWKPIIDCLENEWHHQCHWWRMKDVAEEMVGQKTRFPVGSEHEDSRLGCSCYRGWQTQLLKSRSETQRGWERCFLSIYGGRVPAPRKMRGAHILFIQHLIWSSSWAVVSSRMWVFEEELDRANRNGERLFMGTLSPSPKYHLLPNSC